MITDNRQRRWLACLMCAVLLLASFSMTVGAIVGATAETDMTLVRFDWGILDPAYGGNAFAENELGHRVSEGFTISYTELAEAVSCPAPDALVTLTDESGVAVEHPDARVSPEGGITFQKKGTAGESTFFFTLESEGTVYGPATVTVYTYGVADSVFVLDYSLPVTLPLEQILQSDVLSLSPDTVTDVDFDENFMGQYGHFTAADEAIVYTPVAFMDGVDTLELTVRLSLPGQEFSENVTGVTMKKSLKVAPANVVYYEDDFAGIRYVNTGDGVKGNIWAVYEGGLKGFEQSADQDMNYGSDPNYAANKTDIFGELPLTRLDGEGLVYDGELLSAVGDEIFRTMYRESFEDGVYTDGNITHTLYGDASNDTIHAMAIKHPGAAELMSFEFTGTGFEIVGRTNAYCYAVLTIKIENLDTGAVTGIPVITDFAGGELTQVPYVAGKDLDYGHYRVTVISSNVKGEDRMVFIDGVRIYHPLTAEEAARLYKADETEATFYEIKDGIAAGSIVFGSAKSDRNGKNTKVEWNCGNVMIEDHASEDGFYEYTLVSCDGVDDYLSCGPNNEIYITNADGADISFIAFYVVLDESFTGTTRSIQVGAHLKSTMEASNDGSVILYGNTAENFGLAEYIFVEGGTEQYFTVDIPWAPINNNGVEQTLVVIATGDPENDIMALTNLKLNGYKISGSPKAEMEAVQDAYDVNACVLMSRMVAIASAWAERNN